MNEKRIPSIALAKCERQFGMGAVLKPRANRGGASALNPGFFPATSRYSLDRSCSGLLDGMCIPRAALSPKHIALPVNVCFPEHA
jgi:hypothetical protein